MSFGYVYAVSGKSRFYKEVAQSIKSLRKYDKNTPIAVFADKHAFTDLLEADHYIVDEDLWHNGQNHYAGKFKALVNSPFERSCFLDTDTYFLEDCSHLFKLLDHFDMALCKDQLEGWQHLTGYQPYNTAVFLVKRNERSQSLLEDAYADMVRGRKIRAQFEGRPEQDFIKGDQPVFSKFAALRDVKIYELPHHYNFRPTVPYFFAWGKVRIVHGRGTEKELEDIGHKINSRIFPRVWFNNEVLYGDYLNFFKRMGEGELSQTIQGGFSEDA